MQRRAGRGRRDRHRRRRPRPTGWSSEATARAEAILVARAQADADRIVQSGQDQHDRSGAARTREAERRSRPAGPPTSGSVADGRAEQARLVSQTEVVQAAHTESARILDSAHAEADRMRHECDRYVDTTLASLEETLTKTLRTIGRGRTALRSGAVADYRD